LITPSLAQPRPPNQPQACHPWQAAAASRSMLRVAAATGAGRLTPTIFFLGLNHRARVHSMSSRILFVLSSLSRELRIHGGVNINGVRTHPGHRWGHRGLQPR